MLLAFLNLPYMDFPSLILLIIIGVGCTGLAFGGDWLTTGAAAVSVNLKINPVVVGLTIVAMATSMPEMVTSLLAATESPGLALGNIIGSNVANTGLILGITAIIAPLAIQLRLITREVPILLCVTILFVGMAFDGFGRLEGIFMLLIMVSYLVYIVRQAAIESKRGESVLVDEAVEVNMSTLRGAFFIALGGLMLALGADVLIGSSVELAYRMGISETLVGLTIVAFGTSLPELAASVSAARSGHSDLCAGNIVGSNLFNILLIGGGVATVIPIPVDRRLFFVEFPALILLTIGLLWVFKTGRTVTRAEGIVLVLLYLGTISLSTLSQMGYLF